MSDKPLQGAAYPGVKRNKKIWRSVAQGKSDPERDIKYRKLHDWKYQLTEDVWIDTDITGFDINTEFIQLYHHGDLCISKGYAWDGASGPAIDTENILFPSLVHDALYQLMRQRLLPIAHRIAADKFLRKLCLEAGMSSIRASWVYWGVRAFGWWYARRRQK